jgi:hypothetical protein
LALIGCAGLLAVFAMTAWRASLQKCATMDEPEHLVSAWILTHYNDFRYDSEDPPLWKYFIAVGTRKDALPINRNSPAWGQLLKSFISEGTFAADALYHAPGVDADALVRAGRARMLAIGVALGVAIAWWAWRLGGAVAGIVALAAYCLDPNIMAYSAMIKNDVVTALALLLLAGGAWILGERASITRWLIVSLMLGAALTVKFSGILGIAILGVMLLIRSLIKQPWPMGRRVAETRGQRLAAAGGMFVGSLLLSWGFVWACYGFRYGPSPDPRQQFDVRGTLEQSAIHDFLAHGDSAKQVQYLDYSRDVRNWHQSAGVRLILWAMNHRLLPQSYLNGLLITWGMSQGRLSFLYGQASWVGWWYYFPLAMAFKTPLATLVGLTAAGMVMLEGARRALASHAWALAATATTPLLYMLAAMHSRLNIGLRHVMPVYPFLFIVLGVAASIAWRWHPRITAGLIAMLIIGLAGETFSAYPDFIPFFNVAVGGSRGGVNLLGDSNIDWGQDLPALAAWQSQHRDRQLFLWYWSTPDPHYYGIRYNTMALNTAPVDQEAITKGAPVVAVGAAVLTDPYSRQAKPWFFASLARQKPIAVLGGSIYLYGAP